MTTRDRIVEAAEGVFDRQGFAGTGIDQITDAAGVSSRTLYKHLSSKTGLIAAVLDRRGQRFTVAFEARTSDELFSALAGWVRANGARGCLFLRALGEDGHAQPPIAAAAAEYRRQLHGLIRGVVAHELGRADDALAEQLLVLFEGATAAASYRGEPSIAAARSAAAALIERARS